MKRFMKKSKWGPLLVFLVLISLVGLAAADGSDLIVTFINPNVGSGAEMFANEPNVISITVKNSGTNPSGPSTLSVTVGTDTYTSAVDGLAAGESKTVTVTDTITTRTGGSSIDIIATADSEGVISESDETNNALTVTRTVYNNGYKGKRWTGGSDLTTQASYTGHMDVVYSTGDSAYTSSWSTKTVIWTAANLPIPSAATIKTARLYQGYTWDSVGSDPNTWTMAFNGASSSPIAIYSDVKGFGGWAYPSGLVVYDVTSAFTKGSTNTMVLTKSASGYPSLYGAYLVVVYEDATTQTEKTIYINDNCDLLAASPAYSATSDEATAYAPFNDVDATGLSSAKAIVIAPSADEVKSPISSTFFFNTQSYTSAIGTGYLSGPQIAFTQYDVLSALTSGSNTARVQSTQQGGTIGDNLVATNVILVVEREEITSAPTAAFDATPRSGDAPLAVTFTDSSTGDITTRLWDFGDGNNSWSTTETSLPHIYTDAGTYTVTLTVTGPGGTDTETEIDYITASSAVIPPLADFSADDTTPDVDQTVTFTDQSTNTPTSWTWEIEGTENTDYLYIDSTSSTSQNPKVQFLVSGTYDVSLTATNDGGSDTESKTEYITVTEVPVPAIEVTVADANVPLGTMVSPQTTGSTTVNVAASGGSNWSVSASDERTTAHKGFMTTEGDLNLENPFELGKDGVNYQMLNSAPVTFWSENTMGTFSATASLKQLVAIGDQPGDYGITVTFTGSIS